MNVAVSLGYKSNPTHKLVYTYSICLDVLRKDTKDLGMNLRFGGGGFPEVTEASLHL
jgi:hypothetical protein